MRFPTLLTLLVLPAVPVAAQGAPASIPIPISRDFNVAAWNPWAVRAPLRLIPEPTRVSAPAVTLPVWRAAAHLAIAQMRGKVVVVDFWNRACAPCIPLHEALARAAPRWRAQGVEVLSVLSSESPEGLEGFLRDHGGSPPFPILLDQDGQALNRFGSYGFPTVVVLDHYGRIAIDRLPGTRRLDELEALFPTLLAARSRP